MSLIVTVHTNQGIIMASDSRGSFTSTKPNLGGQTTFLSGHFFDTVEKTFLAPNKCGISAVGDASINNQLISGVIKTFTRTLVTKTDSVFDTASKLLNYIKSLSSSTNATFHIFGFDTDSQGNRVICGYLVQTKGIVSLMKVDTNIAGAMWAGEIEILSRLLTKSFFISSLQLIPAQSQITLPPHGTTSNSMITLVNESMLVDRSNFSINEHLNIPWDLMTIQDGIDFVEYAIKTTIETMKFTTVNKTVGGPIDILIISSDKATWIRRKRSY